MLRLVDDFLNGITMYRLVLYELIALFLASLALSVFGLVPGSPAMLLLSLLLITALCWAVNAFFAAAFNAPTNAESVFISALILVFLLTPPASPGDLRFLELAGWASVWTAASKFILAIRRKHVFNPAALGVALTALALNQAASWWVGTLAMLPFVTVGGLLVTRKLRHFDLVLSFLAVALLAIGAGHLSSAGVFAATLGNALTSTPLVFFATVMLTEPLTTPPTRNLRIAYGALTGLLVAPWMHVGSFYSTPELALLAGNVFAYLVSPKEKLLLTLREKVRVAADVFDFRFTPDRRLSFRPGQYLEWTLDHDRPDARGNRRSFTIASSPTEEDITMGVKFYPNPSNYKRKLLAFQPGDTIVASQLSGEFVLPADPSRKLVFIAGGIGITPFRSMVRFLLDRNERRPIILLYSNRTPADIAYREVFDAAAAKLNIGTVYTLTDAAAAPPGWGGRTGRIDAAMIREEVPDFAERLFYVSGTHAMVSGMADVLRRMGVPRSHVIRDFFPGF